MPLPSVGQALRVRTALQSNGFYRSRLTDVTNDSFFIEPPLSTDNMPFVRLPGEEMWIEFQAIDGAKCYFKTKLLQFVDKPMHGWVVERPSLDEVEREQRREFFRVDVDIPVRLESSRGGAMQMWEVRSKDLSGGGIGLLLPRAVTLSVGSTVNCKFTIPKVNFPVDTQGSVVRVSERNESGFALGSIQFLKMRENVRQKIIQYAFWRQRFLSGITDEPLHK